MKEICRALLFSHHLPARAALLGDEDPRIVPEFGGAGQAESLRLFPVLISRVSSAVNGERESGDDTPLEMSGETEPILTWQLFIE